MRGHASVIILAILALAIVFLWSATSEGATHVVSGGETLVSISNKYDCDYRNIKRVINGQAVEIQNKDYIVPGWKLQIPVQSEKREGGTEKAVQLVRHVVESGEYPSLIAKKYTGDWRDFKKIRQGSPSGDLLNKNSVIHPGDVLYIPVKKEIDDKPASQSVIRSDSEPESAEVASNHKDSQGNDAEDFYSALQEVKSKKNQAKERESSSEQVSNSGKEKRLKVKSFSGAIESFKVTYSHYRDLDVSGENRIREGWNAMLSMRIRPFRYGNWDFGLAGYFLKGESKSEREDDKRAKYKYERPGVGLSSEWEKNHRSLAFEALASRQVTEGSYNYKEDTPKQTTWMAELRSNFNSDFKRQQGDLWFPEWGIGAKVVIPFHEKLEADDPSAEIYDEGRYTLYGDVWLYDLWFSKNWRLTPGLNLGGGFIEGKDSFYLQGGPQFALGGINDELLEVSLINPQYFLSESARDASRLYDFIGTVNLEKTGRILWASQIKPYEPGSQQDEQVGKNTQKSPFPNQTPFDSERGFDGP
ncbi:MAG: LysM domain-containing protein [Candidatus Moranbacteria bacterium]|nr:LysM domain-containing protein [Candidatus Moranbacteria bacterium]